MSAPKNSPQTRSAVVYDIERSPSSTDSLLPPNIDQIISRKRKWYHRILHFSFPRKTQIVVSSACIALSSVQANGVYVWPTYGTVVAKKLGLDGTQAQTVVVGGILGVYIMAAPLGSITDRYGPRIGSMLSAILAAIGYFSFSILLDRASPDTPFIHLYLTASYFLIGAATVGSYFAALTCASLSFSSHPTLSLSVPLSILSLSSLFLSSFSSLSIFQDNQGELQASKFLSFLGVLSFSINILSSIFMRIIPPKPISLPTGPSEALSSHQASFGENHNNEEWEDDEGEIHSPMSQLLHLDEHTPLLIGGTEAAREDAEAIVRGKERWTVKRLFLDFGGFWTFGILLALCIGPSETVIASIGSILTSLLPPTTSPNSTSPASAASSLVSLDWLAPFSIHPVSTSISFSSLASIATPPSQALLLRNKHVSILSISGTVSRLLTGFMADHLAPPLTAVLVPHGPGQNDMNASMHVYIQRKPVILLRTTFNALCAILLSVVFAWSAGWLETESGLWVLSAGTGVMYGALFTLTPAVVSAHFGPTSFGLAWGMISYFAAIGAMLFSYLYAVISTSIATSSDPHGFLKGNNPPICYGTKCFSMTLWVAAGCCLISGLGMFVVGRKWNV